MNKPRYILRRSGLFLAIMLMAWHSPSAFAQVVSASSYIQMHRDDQVVWRSWGSAALDEAKRRNRPVLLSIGYSACHWCHAMQRESFAKGRVAEAINRNFIPILVDREEMPGLDATFQNLSLQMGWRTGWPLTLFLTPEGQAFYGGGYFPKEDTAGVPAFETVLNTILELYHENSVGLSRNVGKSEEILSRFGRTKEGSVNPALLELMARSLLGGVDQANGGFGGEKKYPEAEALEFLWRSHLASRDETFGTAIQQSVEAMLTGAIRDHVGGGFFRYTVDPRWQTPHFEKMLNVNAALLGLLTEIWSETGQDDIKLAIHETVDFLLTEMRLPSGVFASSLDADSRNDFGDEAEGAYYLWSESEIKTILGEGAANFFLNYQLARAGDGGIPMLRHGGKSQPGALEQLHTARGLRSPPRRDEKIIADWNAFAIRALAEAGTVFDNQAWVATSQKAFASIKAMLTDAGGRLRHSRLGDRHGPGATLRDYAALANASISLYEVTGERKYLSDARRWTNLMRRMLDSEARNMKASRGGSIGVLHRQAPIHLDDPDASEAAMVAEIMVRLGHLSGHKILLMKAERILQSLMGEADESGRAMSGFLNAADTLLNALQIVVIGAIDEPETSALVRTVFQTSLPARILQTVPPGASLPEGHPAWGKGQIEGRATTYVCRGTICSLPVTDSNVLRTTLTSMRGRY